MSNIAVIPARGGSKRLPRKNIKPFAGKPMIAWSIQAALASGLFEHVIVSTDDDEIAGIAREYGAETPFMRPAELADDLTPTVPVIAHAVEMCGTLGWQVDNACCIYPCAPLLHVGDLKCAHELLIAQDVAFVYPVTDYAHPIQRAMRRLDSGAMQFISPEFEMTRTQDLEHLYHDAGQFYFGQASAWIAQKRMHTAGIGMPIPNWRVVDIDTQEDWIRSELVFGSISTMQSRHSA